jgi:hypothetical protein
MCKSLPSRAQDVAHRPHENNGNKIERQLIAEDCIYYVSSLQWNLCSWRLPALTPSSVETALRNIDYRLA